MPSHVPPHKKIILSRMGRRASGCWSLPRNQSRILLSLILRWDGKEHLHGADSGTLKRGISGYRGLFYHRGRFLYQLESWYHPEQVMAQAVLLVSGRTYEDGGVPLEDKVAYFNEKYNADIRILHNPKIDVASADIRKKRQKAGIFQKTCRRLWRSISERQACI